MKTDQTGQMGRLILIFACHTCLIVSFVMCWLFIALDMRGIQINIFLFFHKNIYFEYSLEVPL